MNKLKKENKNENKKENEIQNETKKLSKEKLFKESIGCIDYSKMFPDEFNKNNVNLNKIHIFYEDDHLIVVLKPSGIDSAKSKYSKISMYEIIQKYLEEKLEENNKDNNKNNLAFLGLIHRLDKPTSGLMVFAKSVRALKKLNKMISNHKITKRYLAVVKGDICEKQNIQIKQESHLINYLCKNGKINKSFVCNKEDKNSKKAELKYIPLKKIERRDNILTLLDIELLTGRHHQIRAQFSNISHPVYHDSKYDKKYKDNYIRLFSYYLSFDHPIYPGDYIFDASKFKDDILIELKNK